MKGILLLTGMLLFSLTLCSCNESHGEESEYIQLKSQVESLQYKVDSLILALREKKTEQPLKIKAKSRAKLPMYSTAQSAGNKKLSVSSYSYAGQCQAITKKGISVAGRPGQMVTAGSMEDKIF